MAYIGLFSFLVSFFLWEFFGSTAGVRIVITVENNGNQRMPMTSFLPSSDTILQTKSVCDYSMYSTNGEGECEKDGGRDSPHKFLLNLDQATNLMPSIHT